MEKRSRNTIITIIIIIVFVISHCDKFMDLDVMSIMSERLASKVSCSHGSYSESF